MDMDNFINNEKAVCFRCNKELNFREKDNKTVIKVNDEHKEVIYCKKCLNR